MKTGNAVADPPSMAVSGVTTSALPAAAATPNRVDTAVAPGPSSVDTRSAGRWAATADGSTPGRSSPPAPGRIDESQADAYWVAATAVPARLTNRTRPSP